MLNITDSNQPRIKFNATKLSLLVVILIVLLTAGYLIVSSYSTAKKINYATADVIIEQQTKRILLASMFSAVRERSRILLKMTTEEDVFELDELSQQFTDQAGIFIAAWDRLLSLPLSDKENKLLLELRGKIKVNAPKQNQIADLLLEGERDEAVRLLFNWALPGQNEVLFRINQLIDEYNTNSIAFIEKVDAEFKGQIFVYIVLGGLLLTVGTLAIIILLTRVTRKEELQLSQALDELAEQKFALDQHSIVAITDVAGTITYANDQFCKVSGYTEEEIIGNNYQLLNSGEKDEAYCQEIYRTLASGKVWKDVMRDKTKDGSFCWLDTTIVPFMGTDNKPRSYIAIRTDITERKLAEEKVRASEERFRDLADLLPEALYETDAALNITYANRCALEMFGISENDLNSGLDSIELFAPEERLRAQKNITKQVKGIDLGIVEYQAMKKDGSLFPVILHASSIKKDNEVTGIRGVVINIAERKQSERALRRSQKMDALGQLTGGIAHDFNNILNIILGNLELLQLQVSEDEGIQKRIQNIHKSTTRAAELTRQLLSFSRHQAENVTITNINSLIEEMGGLISHSITPQVDLKMQLADELWPTEISPGDFEDSLLNLVINARDAMTGSGHLSIETGNTVLDAKYCSNNLDVEPGDYVRLIISDSGEGMAAEQLEHIYEPFYTTKEQGKGTGLGLAMVFGFIQRSKGHIKVESEQGMGTRFRLYLPATRKKILPVDKPLALSESTLPEGSETILVVDDENSLLELAEELLLDLGYKVLTAGSGQQALDVLSKESNIDLMISDVIMPGGMSGYELAEQATSDHPELKVIMASGYTEKIETSENHKRFSAHSLTKPYSQAALAQKVSQVLKG